MKNGILINFKKIYFPYLFYNKKYKIFLNKQQKNKYLDYRNECFKGDKILLHNNFIIKIY